jgi:hypothetical protein
VTPWPSSHSIRCSPHLICWLLLALTLGSATRSSLRNRTRQLWPVANGLHWTCFAATSMCLQYPGVLSLPCWYANRTALASNISAGLTFGSHRHPRLNVRSQAHFATLEMHAEKLAEFGSIAGAAELLEYATRCRRTYAEVLMDFPSARPPLAYYLDLIPPLRGASRRSAVERAMGLRPAMLCGRAHLSRTLCNTSVGHPLRLPRAQRDTFRFHHRRSCTPPPSTSRYLLCDIQLASTLRASEFAPPTSPD